MTIAAAAPKTGDLPLTGAKDASKQKGLTGSTISERPDPLVVERAREHADNLDQIEIFKRKSNISGQALLKAFQKSKRKRFVTIITDHGNHRFEAKELYKLDHKKDKTVQ